MIRIKTYKEHINGKKIFDRYLYMVACILPFDPHDVIGENTLYVDGKEYTADNFIAQKKRKRTEKYKKLLEKYEVSYDDNKYLENNRLLAAKVIYEFSEELYSYLYQTSYENKPTETPKVNKNNLRRLLTAKMDDLDIDDLINNIKNNRDKKFCDILTKKSTDEKLSKELSKKYKEISEDLLEVVFCYDEFSRDENAINLLYDMGVNVCPYCNRLYTYTLKGGKGKSRPQFDHYKSKSKYPYFAVSLMNLIPSCGLCNQSKSDSEDGVMYPYSDEMGDDAVFRTKIKNDGISYLTGNRNALNEFSVELKLVNENIPSKLKTKIENSDKAFNLTELYNNHKEYILNLFWKNYIFNEEYLESLCKEFPEAFESFNDAKNMMYLMQIDKDNWGKWSLGKLTHDIDKEING